MALDAVGVVTSIGILLGLFALTAFCVFLCYYNDYKIARQRQRYAIPVQDYQPVGYQLPPGLPRQEIPPQMLQYQQPGSPQFLPYQPYVPYYQPSPPYTPSRGPIGSNPAPAPPVQRHYLPNQSSSQYYLEPQEYTPSSAPVGHNPAPVPSSAHVGL